ncbi:MAG: polysaccharide deacetylase family protein [Pseudobdellovibrio sp.]
MFILKEPNWVIRKISNPTNVKKIYLTFDDGPCPINTPAVLDLLKKHNSTATFFVIGSKVLSNISLVQSMIQYGHEVLSHSKDHSYSNYFKAIPIIQRWISTSISELNQLAAINKTGFRPPAGILNPPLVAAAKNLHVPLILWNHRFYDTVSSLSRKKIDKKMPKINSGDIILLHDHQKEKNKANFLFCLEYLILELKKRDFQIIALSQADILSACSFKND